MLRPTYGHCMLLLPCFLLLISLASGWAIDFSSYCVTLNGTHKTPGTVTHTTSVYKEFFVTKTFQPATTIPFSTNTTTWTILYGSYVYTSTTTFYETAFWTTYWTTTTSTYTTNIAVETKISTSAPTTVTIPTPKGFTPLISNPLPGEAKFTPTPKPAPASVTCIEKYIYLTTITIRVPKTSIRTVTKTKSTATTTVIASTLTTYYDEGYDYEYYFISSTITWPTAAYTLSTTTTTVSVPTATYYAACTPDNTVQSVHGYNLSFWETNAGTITTYAQDAYGCCSQCFESVNCTGSSFFPIESVGYDEYDSILLTENCVLFFLPIGDKCSAAKTEAWTYYGLLRFSLGYYFSNGPCGRGVLETPYNGYD